MFGLDSLGFHADVGVKVNTPLWRINSASQQLGFSVSETQSHSARCISDTAPPPHLHPTNPPADIDFYWLRGRRHVDSFPRHGGLQMCLLRRDYTSCELIG